MEKFISVITPSLNSGKYIEQAIKSVLRQDYLSFEHIIIDGGSSDETLSVMRKYPHLLWISEPDNGQADAMNKGFAMSKGEIIVFLNADDFFEDGAFSVVSHAFEQYEKSEVIVGYLRLLYDDKREVITGKKFRPDLCSMLQWWKRDAYPLNPACYFYVRSVQEKIRFDNNLSYSFDYKFLIECAANKITFSRIPRTLGTFRFMKECKTYKTADPKYFSELYGFTKKYWILCPFPKRISLPFFHYYHLSPVARFFRILGQVTIGITEKIQSL